nr:MAG TPA: hypothetical protein [Caudoviricetes sp.]
MRGWRAYWCALVGGPDLEHPWPCLRCPQTASDGLKGPGGYPR